MNRSSAKVKNKIIRCIQIGLGSDKKMESSSLGEKIDQSQIHFDEGKQKMEWPNHSLQYRKMGYIKDVKLDNFMWVESFVFVAYFEL